MRSIYDRDRGGETVSPDDPGYETLIDDIFNTMETARRLSDVSLRDQKSLCRQDGNSTLYYINLQIADIQAHRKL